MKRYEHLFEHFLVTHSPIFFYVEGQVVKKKRFCEVMFQVFSSDEINEREREREGILLRGSTSGKRRPNLTEVNESNGKNGQSQAK